MQRGRYAACRHSNVSRGEDLAEKGVTLGIEAGIEVDRPVVVGIHRSVIRIVIAEDHRLFREAVRTLLESDRNLQVVGEAGNGRDAVRLVHERRPEILLMDLHMPVMSGLAALRELSAGTPRVRTLLMAAEITDAQIVEAL